MFTISDDTGFLAIIDHASYISFVSEDWELDQLLDHFRHEMNQGHLLIWATGEEKDWLVEMKQDFSDKQGYRDKIGSITVTDERLYLINYESLTMGAQFSDLQLPEAHMREMFIQVPNGNYDVRIVQFYNPHDDTYIGRDDIDLLIELRRTTEPAHPWTDIPWFKGSM